MSEHKNQPFTRRLRFAIAGIAAAWQSERSFRIQAVVLAGVLIALLALRLEAAWWALVALTSTTVLAAELFNTALEHLADHLHPEAHPRIRIVKDCAAAAVLLSSVGALAVAAAVAIHLFQRS